MTLDILALDLSDLYNKYHQLVIHQNGITYFITDGNITQQFNDTYLGAKPYGVYTDNGVELWPMNYMDNVKQATKQAVIPKEYDYDDTDCDDTDDYFSNQIKHYSENDDDILSSRKKLKAKKR